MRQQFGLRLLVVADSVDVLWRRLRLQRQLRQQRLRMRLQYHSDFGCTLLLRLQQLITVVHTEGARANVLFLFARRRADDAFDTAPCRVYTIDMRYGYLSWWLSFSCKPLVYRIWKFLATTCMFVAWVLFVAVYPERYWQFTYTAVLPVAAVDTVWDVVCYVLYRRKQKGRADDVPSADASSVESADIEA